MTLQKSSSKKMIRFKKNPNKPKIKTLKNKILKNKILKRILVKIPTPNVKNPWTILPKVLSWQKMANKSDPPSSVFWVTSTQEKPPYSIVSETPMCRRAKLEVLPNKSGLLSSLRIVSSLKCKNLPTLTQSMWMSLDFWLLTLLGTKVSPIWETEEVPCAIWLFWL